MSIYQQYLNYLNQAMPDISGIFKTSPQSPIGPITKLPVPIDP